VRKTEKAKIREAIRLLMGEECQVLEAVSILGSMVGIKIPAMEILKRDDFRVLTLKEVACRPNAPFRVRGFRPEGGAG